MSETRTFTLPALTVAQAGELISNALKVQREESIKKHRAAILELMSRLNEKPREYKNPDAPCTIAQVVLGRRLKLGEFGGQD